MEFARKRYICSSTDVIVSDRLFRTKSLESQALLGQILEGNEMGNSQEEQPMTDRRSGSVLSLSIRSDGLPRAALAHLANTLLIVCSRLSDGKTQSEMVQGDSSNLPCWISPCPS